MKNSRLFAVDPSLTCSGWALFQIETGELSAIGKIKSISSKNPLCVRLDDLQQKISSIFRQFGIHKNDVLVCEAPTTMRDPKAVIKVEQVRGIFENSARALGASVPGRLNSRSVQFEVIGLRGKQLRREEVKAAAVRVAAQLYKQPLIKLNFPADEASLKKHQDIVDALLIGSLALSRIKSSLATGMPLEEVFDARQQRITARAS